MRPELDGHSHRRTGFCSLQIVKTARGDPAFIGASLHAKVIFEASRGVAVLRARQPLRSRYLSLQMVEAAQLGRVGMRKLGHSFQKSHFARICEKP
jgi:hypothetical protein